MKKYKDKLLVIQNFNIQDFGFKKSKSRKIIAKNEDIFINWILQTLRAMAECPDKKYNTCCIYMNNHNNNILNEYFSPMFWLSYSPTTNDELKDSEYGIDLNDLFEIDYP